MTSTADYFSIYHDKEFGLYSNVTPVHHRAVKEAMLLIKDALGEVLLSTDSIIDN